MGAPLLEGAGGFANSLREDNLDRVDQKPTFPTCSIVFKGNTVLA